MGEKVLTAAIALIKVTDSTGKLQVIGKMRNVRVNEQIRRGRVVGVGEVNPSELPVLEWVGTMNASQYAIKLKTSIMKALSRNFSTVADFVQNLLFDEGVDVSLLRKVKNTDGSYTYETFAKVEGAQLTSEGLDISEGQIAGRDGAFEFMKPVIYS